MSVGRRYCTLSTKRMNPRISLLGKWKVCDSYAAWKLPSRIFGATCRKHSTEAHKNTLSLPRSFSTANTMASLTVPAEELQETLSFLEGEEEGEETSDEEEESDEESDDDEEEGDVDVACLDEDLLDLNVENVVLPDHACAYCGIYRPDSVAQCVSTEKWFCNASHGMAASCLVQHLVYSRTTVVRLHEDSTLGDSVLECYNCEGTNVFSLGYIPAKDKDVVVLLCRSCMTRKDMVEDGWDFSRWTSLMKDKSFLPWLLKVPSEKEQMRARQITMDQTRMLEDMWRTNPMATIDDLELAAKTEGPKPVQVQYDDAYEYQNIFGPLVKLEADEDKKMKEAQTQKDVVVEWDTGLSQKRIARFQFKDIYGHVQVDFRLNKGDELRLKLSAVCSGTGKPWEASGFVLGVLDNGEVSLEIKKGPKTEVTEGFTVEFVWKSVTFDRMQSALRSFAMESHSVSGYLYHRLLGNDNVKQPKVYAQVPRQLKAPGLPPLNPSQEDALRDVLRKPLSLIQGPPGTGKTVTSATLVYLMVQQNLMQEKKDGMKRQVLVAAPSNVAVDHLSEKLHKAGLNIVRLTSKAREEVASNVDFLCLHNMVPEANPEVKKLLLLRQEAGDLTPRDLNRLFRLRRRTELELLNLADVICCTCVGAGDPRLLDRSMKKGQKRRRFQQVVLDEATQATEPEALIPIVTGAKQLVMVGDHQQLPPVVMCKEAQKAGLGQSLFERLIHRGVKEHRLTVQYRMHPCLSIFPSNAFYDGVLQNGVGADEREMDRVTLPFPKKESPMFFYIVNGIEEVGSTGTSYLNREEAMYVENLVTGMLRGGMTPDQIGVITPYHAQRSYLQTYMARNGAFSAKLYDQVEVASVDAFQGREKDIIIFSCVRSNEKQGIGFLRDARRLNVALTRAKYGLIILGNPQVLANDSLLWYDLIQHFRAYELLMEGPLVRLTTSLVHINPPVDRRKGGKKKAGERT
jgi:regulator of nonsense transcripts 1